MMQQAYRTLTTRKHIAVAVIAALVVLVCAAVEAAK